jgi:hypothetical protein
LISALSASIFICLVIFWISPVFWQATWLTSAVRRAVSVETSVRLWALLRPEGAIFKAAAAAGGISGTPICLGRKRYSAGRLSDSC